ncbi:hypothetical protein [Streptomyces sp. NPDC046712]|uniref:hypothetical protein n=1 Tax=Streptomyces sp. NPDC046712 TaxID=3154802 RepID=UPI0034021090
MYSESIREFFDRNLPALTVVAAHNDYEDGPRGTAAFLLWPTVLECEAVEGAAPQDVVTAVREIRQELWGRRILAVAACDFEDELPDPPTTLVTV